MPLLDQCWYTRLPHPVDCKLTRVRTESCSPSHPLPCMWLRSQEELRTNRERWQGAGCESPDKRSQAHVRSMDLFPGSPSTGTRIVKASFSGGLIGSDCPQPRGSFSLGLHKNIKSLVENEVTTPKSELCQVNLNPIMHSECIHFTVLFVLIQICSHQRPLSQV